MAHKEYGSSINISQHSWDCCQNSQRTSNVKRGYYHCTAERVIVRNVDWCTCGGYRKESGLWKEGDFGRLGEVAVLTCSHGGDVQSESKVVCGVAM